MNSTEKPPVRLIDLFELGDGAFAVLARHHVHTLADWDRLLEKQRHRFTTTTNSPAEVLWHLSGYRLDFAAAAEAVAVLAAARQEGGAACPR